MAIKTCIKCNVKYTKGVSGFDIFPREDHRWCSYKCLFLWLLIHDVTCNGEYILSIWHRKGRVKQTLNLEDCLSVEEVHANVPLEIRDKIKASLD